MATPLPCPSRPSNGPLNKPLPALPVAKSRACARTTLALSSAKFKSPESSLRDSSTAMANPAQPPASALPQTRPSPSINDKTIKKTINSFPHPPEDGNQSGIKSPNGPLPNENPQSCNSSTSRPLNRTGEAKSANRTSTLPQSRSSSAQDSNLMLAPMHKDHGPGLAQEAVTASNSTSDKRSPKTEGRVIVSVRVRPNNKADQQSAEEKWTVDGPKKWERPLLLRYAGTLGLSVPLDSILLTRLLDNVFTTHDNNAHVYNHVAKQLVRQVMEGYHGTAFTYGMSGTGKTFSMQGTASTPGIIPLAIADIFSYIDKSSREFSLSISYLEIYNEKIFDLLNTPREEGLRGNVRQEEIKLREDSKRGVYATPLKEEIVQSPVQLLEVISRGNKARRTASTEFNNRSSRGHAIIQIIVESHEPVPGGSAGSMELTRSGPFPIGARVSTLSLIDLAGSEKAAESKERRQEGGHIKKSLLTLGTVIARLSGRKKDRGEGYYKEGRYIPYRQSKLTRLLQGALSGNSLISILCTIQIGATDSTAIANNHTKETLNTLEFASRAKNITGHATRAKEASHAGDESRAETFHKRFRTETEMRRQPDEEANKNDATESKLGEEAKKVREQIAESHEGQMLEVQLPSTVLKKRVNQNARLVLSSKSIGISELLYKRVATIVYRILAFLGCYIQRNGAVLHKNGFTGRTEPSFASRFSRQDPLHHLVGEATSPSAGPSSSRGEAHAYGKAVEKKVRTN
ncbi:kinesin motor domain-containing protein [Hirsutella rhossiliensis]